MGKKLPSTPKSKVRASLRHLWLRSRERAAALKRDKYTCVHCGDKQSKRKGAEVAVQVHHKNGIEWEDMIDYIFKHLLCDPKELETLCVTCHDKVERSKDGKNRRMSSGLSPVGKSRGSVHGRKAKLDNGSGAKPWTYGDCGEEAICGILGLTLEKSSEEGRPEGQRVYDSQQPQMRGASTASIGKDTDCCAEVLQAKAGKDDPSCQAETDCSIGCVCDQDPSGEG